MLFRFIFSSFILRLLPLDDVLLVVAGAWAWR